VLIAKWTDTLGIRGGKDYRLHRESVGGTEKILTHLDLEGTAPDGDAR
jgi:hypothetical protein